MYIFSFLKIFSKNPGPVSEIHEKLDLELTVPVPQHSYRADSPLTQGWYGAGGREDSVGEETSPGLYTARHLTR
jgi:hypothetical protein